VQKPYSVCMITGGWVWLVCPVVAATWLCSRFIVRRLSDQISKQSENEVQALKFLRIAVDELRLELKSRSQLRATAITRLSL
jgi:hypothetical protein